MGQCNKKTGDAGTKPIRCLSDDELEALISAANSDNAELMILLMGDAGLRISEVLGLRWNDLWMMGEPVNAIEVTAAIAKNKKARTIPVTARLHDKISVVYGKVKSDLPSFRSKPVFYNTWSEKTLTPRQVQRIISRLGVETIKKRVTPHMLRHTFATRLMRRCPMRVVQKLLGHSSLQSTEIYMHPNNIDYQNAIDSLNGKTVTETQGPRPESSVDLQEG